MFFLFEMIFKRLTLGSWILPSRYPPFVFPVSLGSHSLGYRNKWSCFTSMDTLWSGGTLMMDTGGVSIRVDNCLDDCLSDRSHIFSFSRATTCHLLLFQPTMFSSFQLSQVFFSFESVHIPFLCRNRKFEFPMMLDGDCHARPSSKDLIQRGVLA